MAERRHQATSGTAHRLDGARPPVRDGGRRRAGARIDRIPGDPADALDARVRGGPRRVRRAAIGEVRAKSLSLTALFLELADEPPTPHGFEARHAAGRRRARQPGVAAAPSAYGVVQALIARRVVGDYRQPDLVRLGFAPLYVRHVDVVRAVAEIAAVVRRGRSSTRGTPRDHGHLMSLVKGGGGGGGEREGGDLRGNRWWATENRAVQKASPAVGGVLGFEHMFESQSGGRWQP